MINQLSTSSARPAALIQLARTIDASQGEIRHQANQLEAAASRYLRNCTEYPTPGLDGLAAAIYDLCRQLTELQLWVVEVRNRFSQADEGNVWTDLSEGATYATANPGNFLRATFITIAALTAPRTPGEAAIRDLLKAWAWDWATFQLLKGIRRLDNASYVGGLKGMVCVLPLATPDLLAGGFVMTALIVVGQWPQLLAEPADPDDPLNLFARGFWVEVFSNTHKDRLLELAHHIEALDRQIRAEIGAFTAPRPPGAAERLDFRSDDRLNVSAEAVFGPPGQQPAPDGLLTPGMGSLLNGAHSLISGSLHEQVSMAETTPGNYVIGINGLSPENMTVTLNGLVSVIMTAYGSDPEANPYYRYVRERLFAYIDQIAPNSTLNLAGHSMGGGMIFLLMKDQAVLERLAAKGITFGSITTIGAVRPVNADEIPPPHLRSDLAHLFARAEIRHYVDTDDALALNVGAGHAGYANVIPLDNGVIDDPTAAHTGYTQESFQSLPPELQVLPYLVDPVTFQLYERTPPPPPPIEEPPTIILAA